MQKIIRRKPTFVVRYDPQIGIDIMKRIEELRIRINELRMNRPWND